MKKFNIMTILATLAFLASIVNLTASTKPFAQYPDNFIPFWSEDKGGHETMLLNTNQIVSITPVYIPQEKKYKKQEILHLKVELANGKVLEVFEDFEEFYTRIRVSQAK
jgi:hypothetical protein